LIATNAHLARGEKTLVVLMSNGLQLEATVEDLDPELDIALVRLAGSGFAHLALEGTASVRAGETAIAVGNPGEG